MTKTKQRIETRLEAAVADEAKVDIKLVQKILDLMLDLENEDAELRIVDGEATANWQSMFEWPDGAPEFLLPNKLWDKIAALDFEIVELLPIILRHWKEIYGHSYPILAGFGIQAVG
jgi:hypothetical protein